LGRYNTILFISLVYCLGNLVLALNVGSTWGLCLGLVFIAIGSGGIKPCVSAFCGDQFKPEQSILLQKAFGLFYWSINFGSFFSFLVVPWVKRGWGYPVAFGVPGVLMLLATLVFWMGRKYYLRMPPSRETKSAGFVQITWYAVTHFGRRQPGQSFWDVARQRFSEREVEAARSVGPILAVFAPIPIFWALFDQTSSTWVLQGNKMVPWKISGSFAIGAEQMQSMNPLLVMGLVPLTLWLYPRIEKWLGVRVSPLRRMGTGMVFGSLAYVVVALLQTRVGAGASLSVLWQTLPYIILTTAEVLISTTGLEFAFTQAAAEMKSLVTSFWLLTVAIGDLFVALFTQLRAHWLHSGGGNASASVSPSTFYLYAGMTFVVALVFILIATQYKERKLELTSTQHG
jgi:POT family proton-dependent oligopeptide transporter